MSKISLPIEQEQKLVAKAKLDINNFSPLYEHYQPHIRRYFAVKLHDAATIDDLTAQVFEKAMRSIASFEWRGFPFSAWLYRIASNLLKDYFRSLKRGNFDSLESQVVDVPSIQATSQDLVQDEWQKKFLHKLLDQLDPQHRQIIYMKFFDGESNQAIAIRLNISETNVSSIVHRVVKKLRTEMQKEYY